jgi:hypothetical protein
MKIKKRFIRFINTIFHKDRKVAIILANYNMPEKADAIAEYLDKNTTNPYDLYLVDNGSKLEKPARNTNVFLKYNVQTCRCWLTGLIAADCTSKIYFSYMFIITSTNFTKKTDDLITNMVDILKNDTNAVGVHPSLTKKSTTNWLHLINRNKKKVRKTWMIDNIASMYRADWFNKIGRFDKDMIYAWGIDLETCYKARKEGRSLWVDDRVQVEKITDIGYKMNRMNMTATDRKLLARQNMDSVMSRKYGEDYFNRMCEEFVNKDML